MRKMKIPDHIMDEFENEIENIKYGSISLSVKRRDSYFYYIIKKNYTIMPNVKDNENKKSSNN